MGKYQFWSLVMVILIVSLLAWGVCANQTETVDGKASNPENVIPSVDGGIIDFSVSPDSKLVALQVNLSDNKAYIAIFDIEERRIVARQPLSGSLSRRVWSWDSKWLALKNDYDIYLFSRTGDSRSLPSVYQIHDELLWREDKPDRFMHTSYKGLDNSFRIHELSADTDYQRVISVKHRIIGLFNVRGKPCFAYLKNDNGNIDPRVVYVAEVGTERPFIEVPLFKIAEWDTPVFEVSPNGKYFFLRAWYSASTLSVVSRVEDAKSVFRSPLKAVMWQEGTFESYEVDWLRIPEFRSRYSSLYNQALMESDSGSDFFLDLKTGSRTLIQKPNYDVVKLLKPAETYPSHPLDFIAITEAGLELLAKSDRAKSALLLRHKVGE